VDLLNCKQIGDIPYGENKFGLWFGITTLTIQAKPGVSEGSFSWGGCWGTTCWVDPMEQRACLLFMQQFPVSHVKISDRFRAMVNAALKD
jgi:hypothetical protein